MKMPHFTSQRTNALEVAFVQNVFERHFRKNVEDANKESSEG